MPYITRKMKNEVLEQGLQELHEYLSTVPIETRKGMVAYVVMELGKNVFPVSYFGKSTGADAVRSAFIELKKELDNYETEKKIQNGGV